MQYDFLQLVISSSLIHALGDLSQAPTGIRTRVPRLRCRRLTNWAIPPSYLSHLWKYNVVVSYYWQVDFNQKCFVIRYSVSVAKLYFIHWSSAIQLLRVPAICLFDLLVLCRVWDVLKMSEIQWRGGGNGSFEIMVLVGPFWVDHRLCSGLCR